MLHRLLDRTYFAHVLPPLPEREETLRERAEGELFGLLGKGSDAFGALARWLDRFRDGIKDKAS